MQDTTPSGCACHPSRGGELPGAELQQPPRQAAPATPPQEGNCRVQNFNNHPVRLRLPPLQRRGIAASTGGEYHPVRLRLPPLHRRGIAASTELQQPPRQAAPATPPQEGNTTPSGCACHPSRGGEYHPVRLRLPPLQRRGIAASTGGELSTPTVYEILFQQPHRICISMVRKIS